MTASINPIRIVETTTRGLRDVRNTSPFWDGAFDMVHKVHLVWKTFEKVSIYGNPDNFLQLLAGHSLQWLAGENVFVKAGASAVMIATSIMACVKEELLLLKEVKKLADVCFDNTYIAPRHKWTKPGDRVFLTPACSHWLKTIFVSFLNQMRLILRKLLEICKRLFLVSMRMISAAEAFSFDPRVVREGTTELFVNLEKCYKLMVENKELLVDFLKDHRSVIEKILTGLGSTCSYDTILTNIERMIPTPENQNRESTLRRYGRFAFQQMAFGLFQSVNMHHYMPRSWIPPLEMDWGETRHQPPPLPPKEWVQIFNRTVVVRDWNFKGVDAYRGKSVFFYQL